MNFTNRGHVETTGKFGVAQERDEDGLRAYQLNSFWLYVDEEDSGYTKHALGDGYWEAWITLWMDRNVEPGSKCLDIGANHGYYTFFLASKGCKVWALEPQENLVDLLSRSNKFNESNVVIKTLAVSNEDGETVVMMIPTNHGMNATISNEHTHSPNGFIESDVKTTTIDVLGEGANGFDFIKVDAEGAEDLIWAGSKEYRKKYPDTLWLMEWRWDRYKNPAEFGHELVSNYNVTYIDESGNEQPILSVDHLATKHDEDWMLVLRSQ